MAEKVISPGVFTNEIDQTFLPSAVANIGAALIGPTVKGPALVPTVVTSFAEYQQKFGDAFKSGSTQVQFLTSHTAEQYLRNSDTLTVVRIMDGAFAPATASVMTSSAAGDITEDGRSGVSFQLTTLADGTIMNNSDTTARTNNILISGSKHNIRYEVSNINKKRGTFTLLIRRGDDTHKRKQILETYNNVTLDPNSTNFISKMVGDQVQTLRFDSGKPFLQLSGSYPNKSKYVRVDSVSETVDYLDENGTIRVNAASSSLPHSGSGSFNGGFAGGADGFSGFDALGNHNGTRTGVKPANFYENITENNTQGFDPTAATEGLSSYQEALDLLSNQDEYDINLILTPGIVSKLHTTVASKIIDVCEERADCFAILDPVPYSSNVTEVTAEAETRDSNFAAVYWPWIKVPDTLVSGTQRWVPPSVVLGGIYAFNDRVAHPWFAPAGFARGALNSVEMASVRLNRTNLDDLYEADINPITAFPGTGEPS